MAWHGGDGRPVFRCLCKSAERSHNATKLTSTQYSSNVQFINSATYQQSTVQAAGADLLDLIGSPVILLSHSQGGIMPWLIADARPDLVMAILSVEPTGPPFEDVI